jgi:hypothetical protein
VAIAARGTPDLMRRVDLNMGSSWMPVRHLSFCRRG